MSMRTPALCIARVPEPGSVAALTQLPDGGKFAGAFSVFFAWCGTYDIQLAIDKKTQRIAFGVFDEISKEFALRLMDLRR